ncbi:MAG TPA: RtcB family protein [Flavitalea sp.]|nr:RtcB family protein [Flavitalea sp.]
MSQTLRGKDLRGIGYPQGPVISIALEVMANHFPKHSRKDLLSLLGEVLDDPKRYINISPFEKIATALLPAPRNENEIDLPGEGINVEIFGSTYIEPGAVEQMQQAARLPVSVAGALMPDAHHGYGLPIGGVLATANAIIPYGVGVDIGCRMCLSVFDLPLETLHNKPDHFKRILNENTLFGAGKEFKKPIEHEVLDRKEFYESGLLRNLQATAARQLGTSGSGNHFVEFGIVEIKERDAILNLPAGNYLSLLSHSGSRALGANIAKHFTKKAKEKRVLPRGAADLAWFDLNEEEGIEYWRAMTLAGDYASACHDVIHRKIKEALGGTLLSKVENHHNFAWKEMHNGREVIVHRKGATPAGKNVLGIIPGSMTAPGYIVKGKGNISSLASASHGAGRTMSRTAALKILSRKELNELLQTSGVQLIGGGLDEAPPAYKNIDAVMQAQEELVTVVGKFVPKIVRME